MTGFREIVASIIRRENLANVSLEDSEEFLAQLTNIIKKTDGARRGFGMEWVKVDSRGRITVPEGFRLLLGIQPGNTMEVHLNRRDSPTHLLIKKAY